MRLQTKQSIGITVALVVLATFAGCSALGGGSSDSCGPGDSKIGDLEGESGNEVSVTGEVTKTVPKGFVVDDGTGEVTVGIATVDVESGDCVTVDGMIQGNYRESDDFIIAATNVTEA